MPYILVCIVRVGVTACAVLLSVHTLHQHDQHAEVDWDQQDVSLQS
jgi:hypothetical protein